MFDLIGFGPDGWGPALLWAAATTLFLSVAGFLTGAALGAIAAFARLSGDRFARAVAFAYSVLFRGVPDLLTIYLLYFGGSVALTMVGHWVGAHGFVGLAAVRHWHGGARNHFRRLSGRSLPRRLPRHPSRRDRGGARLRDVRGNDVAPSRRPAGSALRHSRPRQRLATRVEGFRARFGHRPGRVDARGAGRRRIDPRALHLLLRRRGALSSHRRCDAAHCSARPKRHARRGFRTA